MGREKIIAFREVGEQREDTTRAKGLRRDLTKFEWFEKLHWFFIANCQQNECTIFNTNKL